MMRDESCLRRQWSLLRALSSARRGLTIQADGRGAGRDRADDPPRPRRLPLVGFPLEEEVGEFGRKAWRIGPGRDRPPLAFTFDEAVALYLGRRLLEPLAGTFFWQASRNAFQKIRAALGPGRPRSTSTGSRGPSIRPGSASRTTRRRPS